MSLFSVMTVGQRGQPEELFLISRQLHFSGVWDVSSAGTALKEHSPFSKKKLKAPREAGQEGN